MGHFNSIKRRVRSSTKNDMTALTVCTFFPAFTRDSHKRSSHPEWPHYYYLRLRRAKRWLVSRRRWYAVSAVWSLDAGRREPQPECVVLRCQNRKNSFHGRMIGLKNKMSLSWTNKFSGQSVQSRWWIRLESVCWILFVLSIKSLAMLLAHFYTMRAKNWIKLIICALTRITLRCITVVVRLLQ